MDKKIYIIKLNKSQVLSELINNDLIGVGTWQVLASNEKDALEELIGHINEDLGVECTDPSVFEILQVFDTKSDFVIGEVDSSYFSPKDVLRLEFMELVEL